MTTKPRTDLLTTEPSGPVADYKAQVQAAQQAYSRIMATAWEQVTAGNLSEPAYWRISNGTVLAECGAAVSAATARYDAAVGRALR